MKRLSTGHMSARQNIISGDPVNIFGVEVPRDVLLVGGIGLGVAVLGVVMTGQRARPSRDTQGDARIVVVR